MPALNVARTLNGARVLQGAAIRFADIRVGFLAVFCAGAVSGLGCDRDGKNPSGDLDPSNSAATLNEPDSDEIASTLAAADPEPKFVGRRVCSECHPGNYELHDASGHASTFAHASDARVADKFIGKEFDAGEPYGKFSYFMEDGTLYARRTRGRSKRTFRWSTR